MKSPKNYFIFLILTFLCSIFLTSCEKLADATFSDKDDIEMGASLDKEIRSKPSEFRILENPELENYVQTIVKQLIRSPLVKRKKVYKYKVTLLNDDKAINAFCTPGGYIYVYTGLLKFLENEASLAAVLSHEIAHAEKRHVRQRMLSALGIELIVSAILGNGSSIFQEMGVKLAGTLALLSNSRADELEADEWGFLYLGNSPYYQGAMSYFFEKISKEEKRSSASKALEKLLSTHPIPEERLKVNSERIRKAKIQPPIPSNLLESRYKKMIRKHLGAGETHDGESIDDKG
ncbi:MAG TPA: M48 family metalloprotease [Leptospiraceae bacterium]|nr:M48 family metalloprotease [Leptospiraceae bacterium]HMX31260.1 M48 family metalloprotease [Leptospiraceae bacterium]HMY29466.1 M48 family metalloprotease [Leptospiraceae bacterium]HMZ64753.1 M48 family metalloprotease [Leptospiraceae bacterium]HNA06347.1 M48 family metalloprotease [Leptospiraceae bacterium]